MTVSSIGSTFSYVPPQLALADTAPKALVAAAAEADTTRDRGSGSGTDGGQSSFPAKTATERLQEAASRPSAGIIVAAQALASAETDVSPRIAAASYAR